MTFLVDIVKVSQQGVLARATFFCSFVQSYCLSVWLVVSALDVSDSVLGA